jgi:hypothetical protein
MDTKDPISHQHCVVATRVTAETMFVLNFFSTIFGCYRQDIVRYAILMFIDRYSHLIGAEIDVDTILEGYMDTTLALTPPKIQQDGSRHTIYRTCEVTPEEIPEYLVAGMDPDIRKVLLRDIVHEDDSLNPNIPMNTPDQKLHRMDTDAAGVHLHEYIAENIDPTSNAVPGECWDEWNEFKKTLTDDTTGLDGLRNADLSNLETEWRAYQEELAKARAVADQPLCQRTSRPRKRKIKQNKPEWKIQDEHDAVVASMSTGTATDDSPKPSNEIDWVGDLFEEALLESSKGLDIAKTAIEPHFSDEQWSFVGSRGSQFY